MQALRRPKSSSPSQRGQVLVMVGLLLGTLLVIAALTVDVGTWLLSRRDYQNAVDAAVLAGAAQIQRPTTDTERRLARQEAWATLERELNLPSIDPVALSSASTGPGGHQVPMPGGLDYTIWVSSPPIIADTAYGGSYTSSSSRTIYARVDRKQPLFFGGLVLPEEPTITAWATAGLNPNRWAVLTLRREGQDGPSQQDIFIGGAPSGLEVIDGDIGGNWNMKLNSSAFLWIHGLPLAQDDSDVYLMNPVSGVPDSADSWSDTQVTTGPPSYDIRPVVPLPAPVEDPDYPLPPLIATAPNFPTTPVPLGDIGGDFRVRSGGPNRAPGGASGSPVSCDPLSPKIGPGYYTDISVDAGTCLILDPTMRHTSITEAVPDVATQLPGGQLPGIFYVNGPIDIQAGAMVVGDGVTVIIRPHPANESHSLTVSGGGVMALNMGQSPIFATGNMKLGAWTSEGLATYLPNGVDWVYNFGLNADTDNVGIAVYVIKREQYNSGVAADDNTEVIKLNAGAALTWSGVTYAPHDNIKLSGQLGHDGIGQFICWTFQFSGGTTVKQQYSGPSQEFPRLLEPTVGQ